MKMTKFNENADSVANRYALRCFCITMAAFSFAWILNQLNIFIVDKAIMNLGVCMALGLFIVCLVTIAVFGISTKWMKYVLMFFIIAITTVIEIMLTYHSVILSVIPIVYSAMYHDTKKMTQYTFLLSIISIFLIVYIGYYTGLCDANMVLLTSKPLSAYITESGTFGLSQINTNPAVTLALYFVFPRVVLCGVFVPICTNISRIIADSRLKEEEMRVLAEIDGMTGLFNKSKYLELVSNIHKFEDSIAVIYWDINGLKQINDSFGHELGDELIVSFAESIRQLSSPSDKAFRVGGDEFVMILHNADEKRAQEKIRLWKELIQDKHVSRDVLVSAAVGYACGSGSNLEELLRRADEMMYENKRKYHANEQ